MDVGATLVSCRVPVPDSGVRETPLGHLTAIDSDPARGQAGTIAGRYTKRIAGASFELGEVPAGRPTVQSTNRGLALRRVQTPQG